MAFKMNPGRGNYPKTGRGVPMSFKQDNLLKQDPPGEDPKSGERTVLIKPSKKIRPKAVREMAKTIVDAAKGGFEGTAYGTGARGSSIKVTKGQHGDKKLNIDISLTKGGGKVVDPTTGGSDLKYTGKTADLSLKEVKQIIRKTGGATFKDGELTGGTTATRTLPAPRPKTEGQLYKEAKIQELKEQKIKAIEAGKARDAERKAKIETYKKRS